MVEKNTKKLNILIWRIDDYGALVDAGVSSTIRGLANEFLQNNHKIYYFTGGKINLPEPVQSFQFPFSKLFRNFPEIFALEYHFRSTRFARKVLKQINSIDFIYQVVHNFNFSGVIIKKEFGYPLFLQVDGIQQWVKKHWGKVYLKTLLRFAEEIEWAGADKIFTVSNLTKQQLIHYGVSEEKIIINPCGFNPELFHPNINADWLRDKLNIRNKFVIGFSGTFGYYHGISFLANSIKLVVDKIPNAVFLFIGDGEFRAQLDEIISRDNLTKYTRITGFVQHSLVPKYLSICNVLVSPCINNDDGTEFFNSPLKNFEYMGMRKPIVATAVGQQKEIFRDRANALLVEERNPEAIANAIFEIYQNPQLAEEISYNAYLDAIRYHTWRDRANRILQEFWKLKGKAET